MEMMWNIEATAEQFNVHRKGVWVNNY